MYQTKLDEIIDFATNNTLSDEVFQAKKEYANQVGKIYEDDQSYENRMSHFLEWYIFDRKLSGKTVTPILEFIKINKDKASQSRRNNQPLQYRSAGSIFKNPKNGTAAGYLIDQAKLKGLKKGDAEISTKHANFIINHGNATSDNITDLIKIINFDTM